jgi:S-adenosylmethionine hydrolase
MTRAPLIALLTDFGERDGYVGVMKGVILGLAPDVTLVDLSHEVPPQDIVAGAWILHTSWRYFPEGTIFLAVVDPGVGSNRKAIALQTAGRIFVGPDNGLFSDVLAASAPDRVVALDNPAYHRASPSATFHGRDIFAPVAAHLAAGVALSALGTPVVPSSLVRLSLPQPAWRAGALIAHVAHVDAFGNLILDVGPKQTDVVLRNEAVEVLAGARRIRRRVQTYSEAPAGECALLRDSSGNLAIVLREGSAALTLGLRRGDEVRLSGLAPSSRSPETL